MRNAGLEEAQAGIKIARRNISNLRYADDTTLMAESEELKSILKKVKEESCSALGVSFTLQIEDQGLVEFDLSSWTHFILISLCFALGLCHAFKSCALPPSLLCHALLLSPVQGTIPLQSYGATTRK